jgi:RNA polymerase sigma-70 factor (ECF subfamily)
MSTDAELLVDFHAPDPNRALSGLFTRFADPLYRLAFSLVRDEAMAEDVVQDTFLSALEHRHQFEGRSSLSTWLYRIAYNRAQTLLRARQPLPLPEEDADEQDSLPFFPASMVEWRETPEAIIARAETQGELDRAIAELPDTLRGAFLLRDVNELSTAEAAEVLAISEAAVKVRLYRARLLLRERLAQVFAGA